MGTIQIIILLSIIPFFCIVLYGILCYLSKDITTLYAFDIGEPLLQV